MSQFSTTLGGNTFSINNERGIHIYDSGALLTKGEIIWKIPKGDGKVYETLYEVIVVNKEREILIEDKVVAKTIESAKFKVGYTFLSSMELDIEDVTIIVRDLGSVEVEKEVK